eukprot:6844977-Prymnesium_polylepis.1
MTRRGRSRRSSWVRYAASSELVKSTRGVARSGSCDGTWARVLAAGARPRGTESRACDARWHERRCAAGGTSGAALHARALVLVASDGS